MPAEGQPKPTKDDYGWCCKLRRKIILRIVGILTEEACGVSDFELRKVWDPDNSTIEITRIRAQYCCWCGTKIEYYARNDALGLVIPYEYQGVDYAYTPDFIVRLTNGLTVVLEVKGYEDEQTRAKHSAAKRWIEAVNNWGKLGQWAFLVTKQPQLVGKELRSLFDLGSTEARSSRIHQTSGVCGGASRIRSTRIPVWTLEQYRRKGLEDTALLKAFPVLEPDDLKAAWQYVTRHPVEINLAITENEEEAQ